MADRADQCYLVVDPQLNTLVKFRYHPEFKAQRGAHGQGSNRTGRTGRDLEIAVPIGTIAFAVGDGGARTQLADLAHPGDRATIAKGGRGGRGNARFVSATNQAPRRADPGEAGRRQCACICGSSCWRMWVWWAFPTPASPR